MFNVDYLWFFFALNQFFADANEGKNKSRLNDINLIECCIQSVAKLCNGKYVRLCSIENKTTIKTKERDFSSDWAANEQMNVPVKLNMR